jgi:hypothetical protein
MATSDDQFDLAPDHSPGKPNIRQLRKAVDQHSELWAFARDPSVVDLTADLFGLDIRFHRSKINFKWSEGGDAVQCTPASSPTQRTGVLVRGEEPLHVHMEPYPARLPPRWGQVGYRSIFAAQATALFHLPQRRNGLRLILRPVARDVAHELPADGDSADAAKAHSRVAKCTRDLRSQARPIRALDPYGMNGFRGAHAAFPCCSGYLGALDRSHEQHALARSFRRAPGKHHFEVCTRLDERFELFGYASCAVIDAYRPNVRLRCLEHHSVLLSRMAGEATIYSDRRASARSHAAN